MAKNSSLTEKYCCFGHTGGAGRHCMGRVILDCSDLAARHTSHVYAGTAADGSRRRECADTAGGPEHRRCRNLADPAPGIGPAKAAAIIAYREEHGPFAALQDVANVPGISEQMTEKWAGLAQTGTPAEKAP